MIFRRPSGPKPREFTGVCVLEAHWSMIFRRPKLENERGDSVAFNSYLNFMFVFFFGPCKGGGFEDWLGGSLYMGTQKHTNIHTYSKFARRTIYTFISIQSIIRIEMESYRQSSSRMRRVYSATGE